MPEMKKKTGEEDGNAVFDRFAEDNSQVEHDMDTDRDERTDWGASFSEPEPQGSDHDTAAPAENLVEPRSEGLVDERDPREVARHEGPGARQPVQQVTPQVREQGFEDRAREQGADIRMEGGMVTMSAATLAALLSAQAQVQVQTETRDVEQATPEVDSAQMEQPGAALFETHAADMYRRSVEDLDHDGIRDVSEDEDGDRVPDDHDVNMGAFGDEDRDHDNIRDVAEDIDGDRVPDDHDTSVGWSEPELPMADPSTFRFVEGYYSGPLGTADVGPHQMDRLEIIEAQKRAEADFINQDPVVRATPDRDLPARS